MWQNFIIDIYSLVTLHGAYHILCEKHILNWPYYVYKLFKKFVFNSVIIFQICEIFSVCCLYDDALWCCSCCTHILWPRSKVWPALARLFEMWSRWVCCVLNFLWLRVPPPKQLKKGEEFYWELKRRLNFFSNKADNQVIFSSYFLVFCKVWEVVHCIFSFFHPYHSYSSNSQCFSFQ